MYTQLPQSYLEPIDINIDSYLNTIARQAQEQQALALGLNDKYLDQQFALRQGTDQLELSALEDQYNRAAKQKDLEDQRAYQNKYKTRQDMADMLGSEWYDPTLAGMANTEYESLFDGFDFDNMDSLDLQKKIMSSKIPELKAVDSFFKQFKGDPKKASMYDSKLIYEDINNGNSFDRTGSRYIKPEFLDAEGNMKSQTTAYQYAAIRANQGASYTQVMRELAAKGFLDNKDVRSNYQFEELFLDENTEKIDPVTGKPKQSNSKNNQGPFGYGFTPSTRTAPLVYNEDYTPYETMSVEEIDNLLQTSTLSPGNKEILSHIQEQRNLIGLDALDRVNKRNEFDLTDTQSQAINTILKSDNDNKKFRTVPGTSPGSKSVDIEDYSATLENSNADLLTKGIFKSQKEIDDYRDLYEKNKSSVNIYNNAINSHINSKTLSEIQFVQIDMPNYKDDKDPFVKLFADHMLNLGSSNVYLTSDINFDGKKGIKGQDLALAGNTDDANAIQVDDIDKDSLQVKGAHVDINGDLLYLVEGKLNANEDNKVKDVTLVVKAPSNDAANQIKELANIFEGTGEYTLADTFRKNSYDKFIFNLSTLDPQAEINYTLDENKHVITNEGNGRFSLKNEDGKYFNEKGKYTSVKTTLNSIQLEGSMNYLEEASQRQVFALGMAESQMQNIPEGTGETQTIEGLYQMSDGWIKKHSPGITDEDLEFFRTDEQAQTQLMSKVWKGDYKKDAEKIIKDNNLDSSEIDMVKVSLHFLGDNDGNKEGGASYYYRTGRIKEATVKARKRSNETYEQAEKRLVVELEGLKRRYINNLR